MTKSAGCLPDVNVWLALASRRHARAGRAARWMDSLSGRACFCRATQAATMGAEVLDASRAWGVCDEIRSDSRVEFVRAAAELESEWPANWTASYLLAFACAVLL
jgi:predicted nucleic acid-binding protein